MDSRRLYVVNISNKDRRVHTYILLTPFYYRYRSNIFLPSKGHPEGVATTDTFQKQGQQSVLPDVKFGLASSVYCVTPLAGGLCILVGKFLFHFFC